MSRDFIVLQKNPSRTYQIDNTCQTNLNSSWLNYRGAWLFITILVLLLKLSFSSIPGISSQWSWTLTNITYNIITFWMFHWQTGIPYQFNQGAYDHLTLWEQLDSEQQFTPTRKYLTIVPIMLFILSTHYTQYNVFMFTLNFIFLIVNLIGKLPYMHKIRIFGINQVPTEY